MMRQPARVGVKAGPPLVAGAIASAVLVVAGMVRGTVPFGEISRGTNDLRQQFVPFHALLWDLLHGKTSGSFLFNWNSGLGVPFLPDFAAYLSSPLAPLVALFPRSRIELAVYVISVAKMALAAAVMTMYLRRLRPAGSAYVAAALAASYAVCGWAIDDAAYVPMWLDGLVALPVLALATEWIRQREHRVLTPIVIAVAWIANFYTAYMATVAVGVLLVARMISGRDGWKQAARTLALAAWSLALGLALTAGLLLPLFDAIRRARPSPPADFQAAPWSDVAARLLPLSEGVGRAPGLYVGTATLLLALTFVFQSRIPVLTRVTYCGLTALVILSLQLAPTQAAWHGWDPPNGSPFREAFVVCALLVVLAWLAVADTPPPRLALSGLALCGAGLVLVALIAFSRSSRLLTPHSAVVALISALVLLSGVWIARRRPAGLATVLVLLVLVEGTLTAVIVDRERSQVLGAGRSWGPAQSGLRQEIINAGSWPGGRMTGLLGYSANEPALVGYEGVAYYSSTMALTTSRALVGLGMSWSNYGRTILDSRRPDPGLLPLLAVTGQIRGRGVSAVTAGPLVTVLSSTAVPGGPFAQRNSLVDRPVYTVPPVTYTQPGRVPVPLVSPVSGPDTGRQTAVLTASCTAGTSVQLYAPRLRGTAKLEGHQRVSVLPSDSVDKNSVGKGVVTLGPSPSSGQVRIRLNTAQIRLPSDPIGCLDARVLARQMAVTRQQRPALVVSGSHLSVTWPRPQSGQAVIATTAVTGWRCTSDGAGPVSQRSGLLAVRIDGARSLQCQYHQPLLPTGLWISALAMLLTLVGGLARRPDPAKVRFTWGVGGLLRRRGRPGSPGPVREPPERSIPPP
jgi:Bacterial membrane protein YfhO